MRLEDITLTDLIAILENVPELFKLGKYQDADFVRKHLALFIHRNGFYGTQNSIGELKSLEKTKTDFVSSEDVTIVIEGVVDLKSIPTITGGGSINYVGKGVLEVDGATVYDGRSSQDSGNVDWGNIMGDIANQVDLQAQLSQKANAVHTHTESQITDLDKYTQAQVDSFLLNKSNVGHGHNDTEIVNNSNALGSSVKDALDNLQSSVSNKAPLVHGHNDVEINNTSTVSGSTVKDALNNINSGKANTSHTHTKSQITDFAHSLSEHSDVPNKPNDGNENILVEENGSLSWKKSSDKRVVAVQFSLTESVYNSDRYFFLWRASSSGTGNNNRSGSDTGYGNGSTNPYLVPFNAKVIGAVMRAGRLGAGGPPASTVNFRTELRSLNLSNNGSLATALLFPFDSSVYNIGNQATLATDGISTIDLTSSNITLNQGDVLGLKADYGSSNNRVITSDNSYVTVYLEQID